MSRSVRLDRKASYGNIGMVSEANSNTIGGIQDGRTKHITYAMEMPVPYSIHPQISEEGDWLPAAIWHLVPLMNIW
jgi:hypothetical protein